MRANLGLVALMVCAALAAGASLIPPAAATDADTEAGRRSILGEWSGEDGTTLTITTSATRPAYLPRPRQEVKADLDRVQAEIESIEAAKIFDWENPESGERIRQDRFKRLDRPWRYLGEKRLTPNAEERVARLRGQVAELEKELRGETAPPVVRLDPVGFERIKTRPAAIPVRIEVGPDCRYAYTDAWFDGSHLVARRTNNTPCTLNKTLPGPVVSALIAGFDPPQWLLLEVEADTATDPALAGASWGLYVSYDPDNYRVSRIFDPHPLESLRFRRTDPGVRVGYGAAEEALP